uniref:Uncharacterized protein n=1 Tax=Grammatophora oceanica TaxID=210454 RepID=A0A7S1YED3_9STRA
MERQRFLHLPNSNPRRETPGGGMTSSLCSAASPAPLSLVPLLLIISSTSSSSASLNSTLARVAIAAIATIACFYGIFQLRKKKRLGFPAALLLLCRSNDTHPMFRRTVSSDP